VGKLLSVSAAGDRATLAVDEVWSAGDLPAVAEVAGDPGQWSGLRDGTYLVLASVNGDRLQSAGRQCAFGFFVMDAGWMALRPAIAHPPVTAPSDESDGPPAQILMAAGAVLVIGLVSVYAFRRVRNQANGQTDG
jgi:hypothetical protein